MKKKVNGQVVDVNISIFEKAFEGLAMGRIAINTLDDRLYYNSELANRCIDTYNTIYRALPFPLYAIETDIRYVTMAIYIQDKIDDIVLDMWVDEGLYIMIESNKALKFIGNTWAIMQTEKKEQSINLDDYRDEIAYEDFEWSLEQLMEGKGLNGYYKQFMPGFVRACKGNAMVMKWELSRILEFGSVPDKIAFIDNRIISMNVHAEYFLDIFSAGKRGTGKKMAVIRVYPDLRTEIKNERQFERVFDFHAYEKRRIEEVDDLLDDGIEKLKKSNLEGFAALFERLVGTGGTRDNIDCVRYTGAIKGDNLIFELGGSVFICKADKYKTATEIARDAKLYSIDNDFVYIRKKSVCESGIVKSVIYSYNIYDGSTRMCRISFEKGNRHGA